MIVVVFASRTKRTVMIVTVMIVVVCRRTKRTVMIVVVCRRTKRTVMIVVVCRQNHEDCDDCYCDDCYCDDCCCLSAEPRGL